MQLLYIWIDNYKNIDKQGFNFSSCYTFDYNIDNKEFKVEENANNIQKFFPDRISNITAVIGGNGSGKSSILELIRELDSGSINFTAENKIIIALYYDGKNSKLAHRKAGIYLNYNIELNNISDRQELIAAHSKLDQQNFLNFWEN